MSIQRSNFAAMAITALGMYGLSKATVQKVIFTTASGRTSATWQAELFVQ